MPVRVLEDWSRYEFVPGKSGERVFTVDGSVDGVTPLTETDAQFQVALKTGVTYRARHDKDPSLVVPEGGIHPKMIVPGYFEVAARFEPLARTNWTVGGGGSLLNREWRIMQPELVEEDELSDATYDGQPNLNSARSLFVDQVTRRSRYYRLRFRRYESPDGLFAKMLMYANHWNNDVVMLPKYGRAEIGTLLIESIVEAEQTLTAPGVVDVEYTLLARPTKRISVMTNGLLTTPFDVPAFWTRRLDAGTLANARNTDGVETLRPIVIKRGIDAGKSPGFPVRLNGRGVPLDQDLFDVQSTDGDVWTLAEKDVINTAGKKVEKTDQASYVWTDETEGPISFAPINFEGNR